MRPASPRLDLSVIAPAHNEQDNLRPLVQQIVAVLDPLPVDYEIVIVNDGSTDRTGRLLRELGSEYPRLRAIAMTQTPPGRGNGQSAAFYAGFRAAQGDLFILLDADLQNDPADIPAMLDRLVDTGADMIQGDRSQARRDTRIKRLSSIVGRLFRRWLLADTIRDTGCSLRVLRRDYALQLPLQFRGMHRFIPVTVRQLGGTVIEMPVRHRPRVAGATKYGIWNRAIPGLIDCFAVRWMRNRRRPVGSVPIAAVPDPEPQMSNLDPVEAVK